MKGYLDKLYEVIHKNSIKRKRMISLVLVLSIFVSSGVFWELRETGITMVNEALCGLEEHSHTEECYEDVLICGLEENEEHSHTEECWERVLSCSTEEHIHTSDCYMDEEPELLPDIESDAVLLDFNEDEDNIVNITSEPEDVDEEVSGSGSGVIRAEEFMAGETEETGTPKINDSNSPSTIQTIDNIANGIKFTLFDYGNGNLEISQNNYGVNWVEDDDHPNGHWTHNKITYEGINTGRTPEQDILFFAYGTPAYEGTPQTDDDNEDHNKYVRDTDNGIYSPSKNNYSGDYNTSTGYSDPISGNRPIQGIVNKTLNQNGYPTLSGSNHPLEYLFNPDSSFDGANVRTTYTDVNHFLKVVDGGAYDHLVYDSNENYAYFNEDTKNFTIYNGTYHIINDDHHRKNDVNNIKFDTNGDPIKYDEPSGYEMAIGFFPFNDFDIRKRDPNFDANVYYEQNTEIYGGGFNHHFGMTMEAEFSNPENPSEDIIFSYSGDDDMWVFVDNVLVLDVGGIHEPTAAMIDFTNGIVWVQDDYMGSAYDSNDLITTIAGITSKPFSKLTKPKNYEEGTRWKVDSLSSHFSGVEIDGEAVNWDQFSNHTIKMFYLERGGCYSNLAMDMNLPTFKSLSVMKNVDKGVYPENYDNIDNSTYQFTLYELSDGEYVKPAGLENNPITIGAGVRYNFPNLDTTKTYKLVETGVDPNIYSEVKINGNPAIQSSNGTDYYIDGIKLDNQNVYTFTNKIRSEDTTLSVRKVWSGGSYNSNSDYDVKFKIFRTDSASGSSPVPVSINGKRTFILNSANNWTWDSVTDGGVKLPTRFGNHVYTYSVVEQNVPMGYKDSYSYIVNGDTTTATITNTDQSETNIYVEKQWAEAVNRPEITLTLKRKSVSYQESQPTNLKIRLFDEKMNPLGEYTTDEVYANGSIEFTLDPVKLPKGITVFKQDGYPKVITGGATVTESGGYFEITNLSAKADPDSSDYANVVDVKLTSDISDDSLLILHHSFSKGTNGWVYHGGSSDKITPSGNNPYAKGDALLIQDRSDAWTGAKLYLDPSQFKVGRTYTFSTYVFYDDVYDSNYQPIEEMPAKIKFAMTYNDGLENGKSSFHQIKEFEVNKGEWTLLTGSVTFPSDLNPYGMYIIIETRNPDDWDDNQPFAGPKYFRMDEFVALEGNQPVTVDRDGRVTVTTEKYVLYDALDSSLGQNAWKTMGGASATSSENNKYMIIDTNKTATYSGIERDIRNLVPGKQYYFKMDFRRIEDTPAPRVQMTIRYRTYSDDNTTNYEQLFRTNDDFNSTNFKSYSTLFSVPVDANPNTINVYIESLDNGKNYKYGVNSFAIKDVNAEEKQGYTPVIVEETGKINYVSNNERFEVLFDRDSATNPLHLEGDYEEETGWRRVVTLNDTKGWTYHWTKGPATDSDINSAFLNEELYTLYKYYIEETGVSGMTVEKDYTVDYENNNVATNDAQSPIIVKNTIIWYTLPATGGPGTRRIYIFGFALTAIGIISAPALFRRRRRRGRYVFLKR